MAIRDNVKYYGSLPGPAPEDRWFVTLDLSGSPDCASEYIVTENGELYLARHACAGLRYRLEQQGLLWQYPDTPEIFLGHQFSFNGVVEIWSEAAAYNVTFRDGYVVRVERTRDE